MSGARIHVERFGLAVKIKMRTAGLAAFVALAAFVVLAAAAAAWAQGEIPAAASREKSLRDARARVLAGDYDGAIAELERLNSAYPNDATVVGALFQALLDAKRYDRAGEVVRQHLAVSPNNPKSLCDLATVQLKTGRKADALESLEALVGSAPREAWPYQMAFETLWQNSELEDAVIMISRGRRATGDSTLFAASAARIHKSASAFGAAAREYVLAGVGQRDPEAAVDGVVQLAEDSAARDAILTVLERAAGDPALEQVARTCLWQVHLIGGACNLAFDQISTLAIGGKLAPEILSLFAARTEAKACYSECAKAYDLALALPASQAHLPRLLLNKAGCEIAGGLLDQAALTCAEVIKRYPNTETACEAGVAMGKIFRDQARYLEAAAEADRVIGAGAAGDAKFDAILLKGDCLVRAGNLEEAFKTYDLVATDWKPVYAQEAFYNLGEINFYQAKFEDATSYYNVTARQYPDQPRANDAIERLLAIKAVKGGLGTSWLSDFAKAALARRQGKTDQAVGLLAQLAADPGQGVIKTESLKALAAIHVERGNFDGAIRLYRLAGDTLATYFSAPALEAIGDLYLRLGRNAEAIQAYEDVIVKFPESVAAGDARRKIDGAKRQAE